MGLLDSNYWQTATEEAQKRAVATPTPRPQAQGASPSIVPNIPTPQQIGNAVAPYVPAPKKPEVAKEGSRNWREYFDNKAVEIVQNNQLSNEDQIKKYGGVVGSQQYWEHKANENPYVSVGKRIGPYAAAGAAIGLVGGPIGAAVGGLIGASIGAVSFPQDDQWDVMSNKGKAEYLANSGTKTTLNMVAAAPAEIVKTPIRYGVSVTQPWVRMAQGKDFSQKALADAPILDVPLLGKIPTYYQSYDEAIQAGNGRLAASLSTGGTALGDAILVGAIAEAGIKALQPRNKNLPSVTSKPGTAPAGETVYRAVDSKGNGASLGKGVYFSDDPKVAQIYGKDVKPFTLPKGTKLLDVTDDAVFQSTMKTALKEIGTKRATSIYAKNPADVAPGVILQEYARRQGYAGIKGGQEFGSVVFDPSLLKPGKAAAGPAASIQNVEPVKQLIQRGSDGRPTGVTRAAADSASEYYTLPKSTAKEYGGNSSNVFFKVTQASPSEIQLSVVQVRSGLVQRGVDALKRNTKNVAGDFGPEVTLQSQIIPLGDDAAKALIQTATDKPPSIPGSITKGMENKLITQDQLNNLARLGEANKLKPQVRDSIVRSVTGKDVMGEMTQAEYVKSAQALGLFNKSNQYVPAEVFVNPASQYLSPARRWMRAYEEKGGAPIYSETYVPMENAMQARDVFRTTWRNSARDLFGDYAKAGRTAERQAIYEYMQGNKGAIVGNTAFEQGVQADLVKIANGLREMYNQVGPQMDVPPEIFLENYQPHIQNTGGVFTLYKEGASQPKSIDFFAKYKREGGPSAPLVDDSLALFDIYVNAGSNSKFVSPTLERISQFTDTLPGTLQGSVKSYVQEKLGYGGRLEQAMNDMVPVLNQKLGVNLPPDTARQLADAVLSTQYAGLLSQPSTWFKQNLQYPLMGYARLGPEYAVEAYRKALSKGGLQELADRGLMVDTSYPYGGALTNESTAVGNVASRYKSTTQAVISPNSLADNVQRGVVYHQFKMQFENAISLYNEGKLNWSQFEQRVGMQHFSPVDQNIARQAIVGGDTESAFNHLVRDVIDETQFPYRKASTMRLGYGFGGKVGTSLLQWPLEASHTVGSWIKTGIKTGNFDPFIRYMASSTLIKRTMEDAFGVDFSRSLYLGPLINDNLLAPIPKLAADTYKMIAQSPVVGYFGGSDNRQEFNDAKDQVIRGINAIGYPGALEIRNLNDFRKIIADGPLKSGPDQGKYAVRDQAGELRYTTDFAGVFMGVLMGFPIDDKVRQSEFNRSVYNAKEDRVQVKKRVMELYQQGDYKAMSELSSQYGIKITAQDLDDYYIPLTDRNFQALPGPLKQELLPKYLELKQQQGQ